jgi:DNA-binding transcriptional MocR family regulator
MSKTVTFEDAAPAGTINFGIGQPSADLLPVDLVRQASHAFFEDAQPFELNYGVIQGDERFLSSLAGLLTTSYGVPVTTDELFVTGGNSQALDLVSTVFADPGDTVFVEEPSYFLAFKIFRDHGLNIVGIPVDDDGLSVDALREALQSHKPAFLYTIPSYHNPGGQSTTEARRRQIVELAEEHDFFIVADEVYQLLHYYDPPPPAYGTMSSGGRVLSLGSFSKILAPGLRLGWIQTAEHLRPQLKEHGFVNSGGCINHISSLIVRQAIDNGSLDSHIKNLRKIYRDRVETMDAALHEHFGGIAKWTRPDGGYFFWLEFDESVDTAHLRSKARDLKAGFQSGAVFSSQGQLKNFLRLSFAHYSEADIREGIARLRAVFGG